MKKIVLLLSVLSGISMGASAQCTPDTTNFASGVYVYPAQLTCIQQGQAYSETQTIKIPDSLAYSLAGTSIEGYIDSVMIDTIYGYPAGISSASSPAWGTWIHPGGYACALFTGTTTALAGNYPLTISGRACGHITVPVIGLIDTCTAYSFTDSYPDTLKVCGNLGISDASADLNLSIYPNPNQGIFTVTVSSVSEINGTLTVVDELGRTINTQSIEVSGTKQIPLQMSNVSPGAYLLVVNAGGVKSVRQFIVN